MASWTKPTPAQSRWRALPEGLRKHVQEVLDAYHQERISVPGKVIQIKKEYDAEITTVAGGVAVKAAGSQEAEQEHFCLAMYEYLSLLDVVSSAGHLISCYRDDNRGGSVTLKGVMRESHDKRRNTVVMVLEGELVDHEGDGNSYKVAVKWYNGHRYTTQHEIDMYKRIKALNKRTLPWVSCSYRLWGEPVLVMNLLTVLDASDHEVDVGVAILQHLKTIHKVCIHSDIKPDNILKDVRRGPPQYYLIDMGASSPHSDRGPEGHARHVHTKDYLHPGTKSHTNVRTDLWELLYSLKAIQLRRTEKRGDVRSGFKGVLARYKKVLDRLEPYPEDSIYDTLCDELTYESRVR